MLYSTSLRYWTLISFAGWKSFSEEQLLYCLIAFRRSKGYNRFSNLNWRAFMTLRVSFQIATNGNAIRVVTVKYVIPPFANTSSQ